MRSKTSFHQFPHSTHFDLTPFAGILFTLSCLLLLVYFPSEPRRALTSLAETPYYCPACFNVPTEASVAVGLAASGRTSFATFNTRLQVAALKLASQQYGIGFSATAVSRLDKLPFLALKLEQLPRLLTNVDAGIAALNLDGNHPGLTDKQLVSCVQAARKLSPAYTQQTADIFLLIDARTDASKVMRLLHMLQNQGVSRFNLVTHCQ